MDLGAYANIEDLNEIMVVNDIKVPRLRGLRLMSRETALTREQLDRYCYDMGLTNCEFCIEGGFQYDPICFEISSHTRKLKDRYLIHNKEGHVIGINWKNIHGKKRKLFKYTMKRAAKDLRAQMLKFNSYVGRNDILMIHARIGGGNWPHYHSYVDTKPWFIEKIDDAFDSTYCDIYARINPDISMKEANEDERSE